MELFAQGADIETRGEESWGKKIPLMKGLK